MKDPMYASLKVDMDLDDLCSQLLDNLTTSEIEYVYERMRDWLRY